MKKLTTLLLVALLAGCASFLAPDFDNHEYGSFVNLHSNVVFMKKECGTDYITTVLNSIKWDSGNLVTYATHIPNNKEITEMAKIVDNDIQEMVTRNESGMSKTYCELKSDQLLIKLDEALDSIGAL